MGLKEWNISWLYIIVSVMLLLSLNVVIFDLVSMGRRSYALWLIFLPVGIVLLITFLLHNLKHRIER